VIVMRGGVREGFDAAALDFVRFEPGLSVGVYAALREVVCSSACDDEGAPAEPVGCEYGSEMGWVRRGTMLILSAGERLVMGGNGLGTRDTYSVHDGGSDVRID
jgi:hypothetical protein